MYLVIVLLRIIFSTVLLNPGIIYLTLFALPHHLILSKICCMPHSLIKFYLTHLFGCKFSLLSVTYFLLIVFNFSLRYLSALPVTWYIFAVMYDLYVMS